jgi:hypothetical protein
MGLHHVYPGEICVYRDEAHTRHLVTVIGMFPQKDADLDPLVNVVTYSGSHGMHVPLSSLQQVQIGKSEKRVPVTPPAEAQHSELVSNHA